MPQVRTTGATTGPARSGRSARAAVSADPGVVAALTTVLVRACRRLGEAGHPQQAGHLAADAWVVLRSGHPREAEHLNGAMHHLARLEQTQDQQRDAASRPTSGQPPVPTRKKVTMSATDPAPSTDRLLDVRNEIPRRRHELIFETFAGLETGTAFVLVNDHDPKPLRYQFEAENAHEFSWEYLEQGPEVWRVRIGRTAGVASTA